MRTTLDIDDVVLSAARGLAAAEGISLGRAVSELAMRGLRGGAQGRAAGHDGADLAWPGFVPLQGYENVSSEQVRDLQRDAEESDDLGRATAGLE